MDAWIDRVVPDGRCRPPVGIQLLSKPAAAEAIQRVTRCARVESGRWL
jgi:hypothetical protein